VIALTLDKMPFSHNCRSARRFYRPRQTIGRRSRCRDHSESLIGTEDIAEGALQPSPHARHSKVRADRNTAAPLIITQALGAAGSRVIRDCAKSSGYRDIVDAVQT